MKSSTLRLFDQQVDGAVWRRVKERTGRDFPLPHEVQLVPYKRVMLAIKAGGLDDVVDFVFEALAP